MSSAKARLATKAPATNESTTDMIEGPPDWGEVEVALPVDEAPVCEATEPDEVVLDFDPPRVAVETVDFTAEVVEMVELAVEEVVMVVEPDVTRREKMPELPPLFESPQ